MTVRVCRARVPKKPQLTNNAELTVHAIRSGWSGITGPAYGWVNPVSTGATLRWPPLARP